MHEMSGSTSEASHGDAQSDIVGGALITVMVLFVGMAVFAAIIFILLRVAQQQLSTTQQQTQTQTQKVAQLEKSLEQLSGKNINSSEIQELLQAGKAQEKIEQIEKERDEAMRKQQEAEAQAAQAASNAVVANAAAANAQAAAAAANANAAAASASAAEAERKYEGLQAKDKEAIGNLVSSGMRLWIFRKGPALITDAEPMPGNKHWQQQYVCRKQMTKLEAVKNNPDLKSDHLLGK